MSVAGISDMSMCVGLSNLESINTFSNATSLMPHTVQRSLLCQPSTLLPISSVSSTLLLFCSAPFNTLAHFPSIIVLRYLGVLWAAGCGMWQWQIFLLRPARSWISSVWLGLQVAKHQIFSPGCWHVRAMTLEALWCLCAGLF